MNATTPQFKTYKVGTLAFLDTFAGMIPCKVIKILINGANGKTIGEQNELQIQLTKTVGAYRKDEIITTNAASVVPKSHLIRRGYKHRVNTLYQYSN